MSESLRPLSPPSSPDHSISTVPAARWQAAIGVGVIAVALGLAIGASLIPSDAGYGGVGASFLPWLCAVVLAVCGAWLVWEACSGGFRHAAPPSGSRRADMGSFVWVSAGLLLNAALIEHAGFILSCTLCFALAVQGLRRAQGQAHGLRGTTLAKDAVVGVLIAAPVYWAFTQFLAINLPGLTDTGWL